MLVTPIANTLARVLGLVDAPGVRKVHHRPTPRIGGVPVVLATLALTIGALLLDNAIGQALREQQGKLTALLAGGAFMFLVGLVDDVRDIRARTKLLGQVLAALAVALAGIRIETIHFGTHALHLGVWAWPVTLLWIIGITNAVNLIDGLDGLAAGIAAMACGVLAAFSLHTQQPVMAILMLALLGSLLGFLVFNFNPAKIFLGDCGSLFIGFMLATSSVLCTLKVPTMAALSVGMLTLGLPAFDMLFSMLRRTIERRSIFAPDRNHIHHRLLRMGLRHRNAVLLLYAANFALASASMLMMFLHDREAVIVLGITVAAMLVLFHLVGAVRIRESYTTLRESLSLARQAREEKRRFEGVQLRMRETKTFPEWWDALCEAAYDMNFLWMRLSVGDGAGATHTHSWYRQRKGRPLVGRIVQVALPGGAVGGAAVSRIDAGLMVNGHIEDAGRRMTLFARLLDEYGVDKALRDLGPQGAMIPRNRLRTVPDPLSSRPHAEDWRCSPPPLAATPVHSFRGPFVVVPPTPGAREIPHAA